MFDLSKAKLNAGATAQKAVKRAGKLLLVDDERENIDGILGILAEEYDILTAENAADALELISREKIHVIISDQKMPGMTGIELFLEAKKRHHNATRIILTGFADIDNVMRGINDAEIYGYLTKPIVGPDLKQKIKEAFDHYESHASNRKLLSLIKKTLEENASLKNRLSSHEDLPTDASEELKFLQKPTRLRLGILFLELYNTNESPEKFDQLKGLFNVLHTIIIDSGGIVDKHMGEGLMAVFGLGDENASIAGISAISNLLEAFPHLSASSYPALKGSKLAVGFSGGEVVIGMLGTENRMEMAVIGETANKAARFKELASYPFLFPKDADALGEIKHGVAVMDKTLQNDDNGFELLKSFNDGELMVRSFPDIQEVAIKRK